MQLCVLPKLHPRGGSIFKTKSPYIKIKVRQISVMFSENQSISIRINVFKLVFLYLVVQRDHEVAIDWSTICLVFQGALFGVQFNLCVTDETN